MCDSQKKLHWNCTFGEIAVQEQTYLAKEGGKLCRPFQSAAKISCRAYSQRLQRVITDFSADVPFAQVQDLRKTRKVFWKEGKLSMVRRSDEITPVFAVTIGDVAAAGADLKRLAMAIGFQRTQPGAWIR